MKRVIVIFPQLSVGEIIENLRRKFDPLALQVKAHITLVAPFEDVISTNELRSKMQEVLRRFQPFPVVLQGITGHEGKYLFLNVKVGNDSIIQLRDAIYEEVLPQHPLSQYTFIPHLTIGRLSLPICWLKALDGCRDELWTAQTVVEAISVYRIEADGTRPVEFSIEL